MSLAYNQMMKKYLSAIRDFTNPNNIHSWRVLLYFHYLKGCTKPKCEVCSKVKK